MFEINSKSFILHVIHTFLKVKLFEFSRQKSRITTAAVLAIQNGFKKMKISA